VNPNLSNSHLASASTQAEVSHWWCAPWDSNPEPSVSAAADM